MKKVLKSKVFIVIITMIICISGTLYATNTYQASEILYNGSDGISMNVNDALNDLYNNTGNDDISSSTELFSFTGVTSSGSSSTYITKSYTYTENDANNKYKYLIFAVDGSGATNLMYDEISNMNLKNNINIVSSATAFGNTVNNSLSIYMIDASELKKDDLVFSITFRGLFIIKLVGVK